MGFPPKPPPDDEPWKQSIKRHAGDSFGWVADVTGLSSLPRSAQVVVLYLTKEQYEALLDYLQRRVGVRYENETMINDCVTMTLRALERFTDFRFNRVYDASPSQAVMYFSALKTAGDARVGKIYDLEVEPIEWHRVRHLSNAYINVLDSKLFISLFWLNQLQRGYFDATSTEETMQKYDDVTLEVMAEWKRDAAEAFATNLQIQAWEQEIIPNLALETGPNLKRAKDELAEVVSSYFEQQIQNCDSQAKVGNPDNYTRIYQGTLKELYESKFMELLLRIEQAGKH